MKYAIYIKSSFTDPRCCDNDSQPDPTITTGWRAQASSIACVKVNGVNNGYAHVATLEQYNLTTSLPTGVTKPNVPSDTNYIPDYLSDNCPVSSNPNPGAGYLGITNHVVCKGYVNVTNASNGALLQRFIVPNTNLLQALEAGHYNIEVLTHSVSDDTPVPCSVSINGLITDSTGDIFVGDIQSSIYIDIYPPGQAPQV